MTVTPTRYMRPSDVLGVLRGLFFAPDLLMGLQAELTPRAFRFITGWICSTALWLPAALALIPIIVRRITAENAPDSGLLISGLALLWILTALAGNIAYESFHGTAVSIIALTIGAVLVGLGMLGLISIMLALSITGAQLDDSLFSVGLSLALSGGIAIAAALDNEISAALVLIITALSVNLRVTVVTLMLAALCATILLKAPDVWWGRPLRWGVLTLWLGGLLIILWSGFVS